MYLTLHSFSLKLYSTKIDLKHTALVDFAVIDPAVDDYAAVDP